MQDERGHPGGVLFFRVGVLHHPQPVTHSLEPAVLRDLQTELEAVPVFFTAKRTGNNQRGLKEFRHRTAKDVPS